MLDPDMLAEQCRLDNGQHDTNVSALASIGLLDKLPVEILQDILVKRLDLATLTSLRRVSSGLRRTIDEFPQYRAIVTHAPASIRAALSLEVAGFFTCRALYTALCARTCYKCGNLERFSMYRPARGLGFDVSRRAGSSCL